MGWRRGCLGCWGISRTGGSRKLKSGVAMKSEDEGRKVVMGKKEMMALKEAEFVKKKIVDWEELSPHHRERTVEIWRMGFEDGWNAELSVGESSSHTLG